MYVSVCDQLFFKICIQSCTGSLNLVPSVVVTHFTRSYCWFVLNGTINSLGLYNYFVLQNFGRSFCGLANCLRSLLFRQNS